MASIYLIRHAQASFATGEYDRLSQLGLQQAKIAGEFLGSTANNITRIITGPLRRQRDTAAELAAKLREARGVAPEVEIVPMLDELRIDEHIARIAPTLPDPSGELAANLADAKTSSSAYQRVIRRVYTHWQQLGHDSQPETWPAFAARARGVIRHITLRNARGGTTLAVSSGALIATISQQVLGVPDGSAYELFEAMKNCSITQFLHSGDRMSLSAFNETLYLDALGAAHGVNNLVTYR